MKLYNVPMIKLQEIVAEVAVNYYEDNITFKRLEQITKNCIIFTLTVEDTKRPGYRRGPSGRKVAAACWHAHRDIMQAIFDQFPHARLISTMARYNGAGDFERNFRKTGQQNVGSMFAPLYMMEACDCCNE